MKNPVRCYTQRLPCAMKPRRLVIQGLRKRDPCFVEYFFVCFDIVILDVLFDVCIFFNMHGSSRNRLERTEGVCVRE